VSKVECFFLTVAGVAETKLLSIQDVFLGPEDTLEAGVDALAAEVVDEGHPLAGGAYKMPSSPPQ
jgi:hypothetical protein